MTTVLARVTRAAIVATTLLSAMGQTLSFAQLPIDPNEAPIGADEGLPRISWQRARRALGRTALVSGKIVGVGHTPRIHFLDFHRTDRNAFKVVIFDESIHRFKKPLDDYQDKLVVIRGRVTSYAGNPQIVVGHPDQIRIVDQLPEPFWPQAPQVSIGDTITVASFNVRNLFDDVDDPYRNDESTPAKPRAALQRLATVIREINADVLALQEVESRGYLQRFLDVFLRDMGYEHVVHHEGNDSRGIDVCLLSRVPVGPVTTYRHLRFSDASGVERQFQRDLLRVTLEPKGATPFEIWVVHLKSNYGGRDTAEPIRLAEANMIRKLVDRELEHDPQAQFVICGDFNDTYDSPSLRTIRGESGRMLLKCFCDQLDPRQQITYNEEPFRSMIDFLLCSPRMAERFVPGSYRIRAGALEESGSDHNPVMASFSLRRG